MGFCKATNITGGAYIVAMLWLAISWFMILSPLYAVSFDQPVVGDARSCTRVLHGVDISYTKVAKVGCGYKTTYEWRALPCVSLPFFPYQDCAQKSIRIMITINGKSHSLPEVLVDKKRLTWTGLNLNQPCDSGLVAVVNKNRAMPRSANSQEGNNPCPGGISPWRNGNWWFTFEQKCDFQ